MIIEKELKRRVEESKFFTKDAILEKQQAHCPVANASDFSHTWELTFRGIDYHMVYPDIDFYKTIEMKYEWFNNTKPRFTMDNMYNLVSKQIIFPVLFFVNGKFQKWTNIDIIPELNDTTYIVIRNIRETRRVLNTVYIPFSDVLYMEDPTEAEAKELKERSDIYICFDKDGYYIPEGSKTPISAIIGLYEINNIDTDTSTTIRLVDNTNYYIIKDDILDNEYIGNTAHIAFDTNNLFIENIEDKLDYVGDNAYKIIDLNRNSIQKIYTFVWKGGNEFKTDLPLRIGSPDSQLVTQYNSSTGKKIEYFNHEVDGKAWNWHNTSQEQNMRKAIKSILEYDQSILKDAYLDRCNVYVEELTVEEMIKKYSTGITDNCHVPKKKMGMMNNSIMVFVDGDLYVRHKSINSETDEFLIPMSNYRDYPTSDVELLFFKDIQNSVYDITIDSENSEIYIPTDINPDYMQLFYLLGDDYKSRFSLEYDNILPNDFTYFNVDFTLERIYGNKFKIHLTNKKLYGQKFKMVSRRQFRHNSIVWELGTSDYHIPLDASFNYVTDDDGFMVFVNYKLLNRENFIVTIPGETRPFDRPVLEITTFLDKNDIIDVFYLPQSIKMLSLGNAKDYAPLAFLLDGDEKNFIYNLSRDLQFFFINGRKVCKKYVHDVTAEHVVITNAHSKYNLNVVYHIEGFKLVNEIYKEIKKPEYIRKIMLDLHKEVNKLGTIMLQSEDFTLMDIEENIQKYHADIKALINNIVMEYYADYGIETNKAFIYDVATDFLEEFLEDSHVEYVKDSNGKLSVRNGSPTDEDEVYCINLFNDEGLLKYDIRNDHIDDESI